MRHNHYTQDVQPLGECLACDANLTRRLEDEVTFMLETALLSAGMNLVDLAQATGLNAKYLGQLVQGKVAMSAPVAVIIEHAVDGLSAEELLYAEARKQIRAARGR